MSYKIEIYKSFEDIVLKRKLKDFFVGAFIFSFLFYGLLFYIYFNDPIYRLIRICSSIIVILSGYLIYHGIGRDL